MATDLEIKRESLARRLADLDAQVAARPAVATALAAKQQAERDAGNAESQRLAAEADKCRSDLRIIDAAIDAAKVVADENVILKAENTTLRQRVAELEQAAAVEEPVEDPIAAR
jgi:regulator of replication initiation timing